MELAAIRHFENRKYCYALEKRRFLVRLETKRGDIARVRLHTQEKYLPDGLSRQTHDMELACRDRYRDYYEAVITIDMVCLRYFFELEDASGQVLYFGGHGFFERPIEDVGQMFDCPQTLREEERFILPGWAKNKVVYQIFPSRFATDKEVPEKVWYQAPISYNVNLRGSLRGIIDRLDYPVVNYTPEQMDEISKVTVDIYKYVQECWANWIVNGGIEDEWDGYIAQLKQMRLERLMEIYQAALDAYNAG